MNGKTWGTSFRNKHFGNDCDLSSSCSLYYLVSIVTIKHCYHTTKNAFHNHRCVLKRYSLLTTKCSNENNLTQLIVKSNFHFGMSNRCWGRKNKIRNKPRVWRLLLIQRSFSVQLIDSGLKRLSKQFYLFLHVYF